MREIIIATRGSALALWQSRAVEGMLRERFPELEVRLEIMSTTGDKILGSPLSQIGDKGLFTKELENALLEGRAHIAVHSLKDMQTRLPDGLTLAAVTRRHAAEDALVGPRGMSIEGLPRGGTVATGSLRRTAQLLQLRPDLTIVDIRGNVGTRLEKYHASGWDGMILARAGLERLGYDSEIAEVIPATTMIPAVGQGALGIEACAGDTATLEIVALLEDAATRRAVEAERAFLRRLEGGCQIPAGAHAVQEGEEIVIDGMIASLNGRELIRERMRRRDGVQVGEELAETLLERGGEGILRTLRG